LPGNAHSHPPIPKKVQVEVFGDEGSLHYEGNDRDPSSGRLEIRNPDGGVEVLHEEFLFENLDNEGSGPESLQNFVQLCCGNMDVYAGADVRDGLRSIQTIDAMYRSHASHQPEKIVTP
jgi:predicted dehydrogenase